MGNLVLTRKLGEVIRIGDSVKITVLQVRSGQVKLGIEAPPEVKVHREEIYERIQEENRKAASLQPPATGTVPNPDKSDPDQGKPPPAMPNQTTSVRNHRTPWPLNLIIGGKPA